MLYALFVYCMWFLGYIIYLFCLRWVLNRFVLRGAEMPNEDADETVPERSATGSRGVLGHPATTYFAAHRVVAVPPSFYPDEDDNLDLDST